MGTVVYQHGFQSYLDSHLNEHRALRLRLSSPNPHFSKPFALALKSHSLDSEDKTADSSDTESSGWSFLQSLSSSSSKTTSSEKEKTYVQRPSSCLSDQSLALCTENLGSESGSDVTDVEDLFLFSLSDVHNKNLEETKTETRTLKSRKVNMSPNDLPPPLTSMRGPQCIQMKPHREDGRLVMTVTKAPPRNQCFQADRSNGRLRLSMLKDLDEFVENKEEMIEPEETEEYEKEDVDEDDDDDDVKDDDDDEVMVMENVRRSRRCLEGDRENRGLLNWVSFCLATS